MTSDLWRIAFINPDFAPVFYPPDQFKWLYSVAGIELFSVSKPGLARMIKKLEFFFAEAYA